MGSGVATPSETANGPGPLKMAAWLEPSSSNGNGFPDLSASSTVRLVVNGAFTGPCASDAPSMFTGPNNVWFSTRRLKTALVNTNGIGATSGDFVRRVASSTRRWYFLSESITVPAEPVGGNGTALVEFRC